MTYTIPTAKLLTVAAMTAAAGVSTEAATVLNWTNIAPVLTLLTAIATLANVLITWRVKGNVDGLMTAKTEALHQATVDAAGARGELKGAADEQARVEVPVKK